LGWEGGREPALHVGGRDPRCFVGRKARTVPNPAAAWRARRCPPRGRPIGRNRTPAGNVGRHDSRHDNGPSQAGATSHDRARGGPALARKLGDGWGADRLAWTIRGGLARIGANPQIHAGVHDGTRTIRAATDSPGRGFRAESKTRTRSACLNSIRKGLGAAIGPKDRPGAKPSRMVRARRRGRSGSMRLSWFLGACAAVAVAGGLVPAARAQDRSPPAGAPAPAAKKASPRPQTRRELTAQHDFGGADDVLRAAEKEFGVTLDLVLDQGWTFFRRAAWEGTEPADAQLVAPSMPTRRSAPSARWRSTGVRGRADAARPEHARVRRRGGRARVVRRVARSAPGGLRGPVGARAVVLRRAEWRRRTTSTPRSSRRTATTESPG